MKKKTSRKRHLFLTKNFIMMLVMLVVIIVAVSAWFTQYKTVTADSISVKAASTESQIARCIKTYNSDGTVKTDGPGTFGDKVVFDIPTDFSSLAKFSKDCTGNGMDLIVPEFNVTNDFESVRKNDGKEVNENLASSPARSNLDIAQYARQNPTVDAENYPDEYKDCKLYELEFYIRSKSKDISLQANSLLVSETELRGHNLSTVLDGKKSEYGNFNVDGLVGAIRVALIGEYCTEVIQNWTNTNQLITEGDQAPTTVRSAKEKQLLWVPRPDVKLNVNQETGNITDWTLSTEVSSGDSYKASYYTPTSGGVTKVEDDNSAVISSGTETVNNVSVKSLGEPTNISHYPSSENWDTVSLNIDTTGVRENYYVTKYTLRVWIEGTDSEARRAMDGGKFSIRLSFG